jgi:hypothetical protein
MVLSERARSLNGMPVCEDDERLATIHAIHPRSEPGCIPGTSARMAFHHGAS